MNTTNKYHESPDHRPSGLSFRQLRKLRRHPRAIIADGKFGPMVVVDEGPKDQERIRFTEWPTNRVFFAWAGSAVFRPSNEGVLRSSEPWQPFSFYVNPTLSKVGTHSAQRNRMK